MPAGSGRARRLRVVTLVDGIGLAGGGEKLAREVTLRLDPERFERTLCVSRWSAELAAIPGVDEAVDELAAANVRLLTLERRSAADLGAWRPLLGLLRRERVDILHSHKFGSNVWAAVLGSLARTPVVIAHEHTWSFQGQPVRRFLDRNLIARRAAAFLTVSSADRERMIAVERIDPGKLIFVPNGIAAPPPPSGRDVRAELGVAPDAFVLGTVATLRPQKALDVLIQAAARLAPRLPDLRVLIVGEGEERSNLQRLTRELGLEETVAMLGFRPDVPDLLQAFDVGVCSSDFEGTPLSILEYMDAGLPVVSTRVGGIPDLIDDGVHGLLVESRSPDALAAAIARLAADPMLRMNLGRRGRQRRRADFDIEVTVRRLESLYEELAARAGRAPAGA